MLEMPDHRGLRGEDVWRELVAGFGAVKDGDGWEDPLGDSWSVPFQVGEERLELDWDHWVGLSIMGVTKGSGDVLARIAEHFRDA